MSGDTKIPTKPDLETVITDLEGFVLDRMNTVDGSANCQNSSELEKAELKGYIRGLWHMGDEILERLRKLL